ncbi:MAG: hypothetical protein NTW86_28655 [Candidatus Sumerlaeota bacterium]|nr:hypothetical protein [Candidatus Sumerlaeota bacterium]
MSDLCILAIETSTLAGGAALWEDGEIVAAIENDSPVSTLEALAWRFARPGELAAALLDARRGEVFGALFEGGAGDDVPLRLTPDVAERPEVFARRIGRPCVLGGSGAERYAGQFREWLGPRFSLAPAGLSHTSPSAVAALGARLFGQGKAVNPLTIEPLYVRKSDAEVARERKSGVWSPAFRRNGFLQLESLLGSFRLKAGLHTPDSKPTRTRRRSSAP